MSRARKEPTGYTMGYGDHWRQVLDRRSAASNAAYLLPYLEPGMRLLDFGCGPGSISIGLAQAVSPGKFFGVDFEASQIDLARAAAWAARLDNATFEVGDATDLRFESDYFDVAHCHALLMHVPDPGAVLAEIKRVLKPGGTIACRELSAGSSFLAPDQGTSDAVWSAFAALLAANGGHPNMGRDLKAVLNRAGFCDICPAVSFDTSSTPAEIDSVFSFLSEWFLSKDVAAAAAKHGLLEIFQTDAWRAAMQLWRAQPDAFAGYAFGEALAKKP